MYGGYNEVGALSERHHSYLLGNGLCDGTVLLVI